MGLTTLKTGQSLAEVSLDSMPGPVTGAIFVTLNKGVMGDWRFTAVNQGFVGIGIGDFFQKLGVA